MIFRSIVGTTTLAVIVGLISCGPGNGDAEVHVSTSGRPDTTVVTVPSDTVTHTVIQKTDTVVQQGTVIKQRTDTQVQIVPGQKNTTPASTVSDNERRLIDKWLLAHADSLNQYGDLKGTAYTGSTPLFNENTGQTMSKYDYIVMKHPDRPWLQ